MGGTACASCCYCVIIDKIRQTATVPTDAIVIINSQNCLFLAQVGALLASNIQNK
jgi:hypothetical protein